jgi:glycosylphosphatidylinositol phospholipase D
MVITGLILLSLITLIHSCGFTVHSIVAEKSLHHYYHPLFHPQYRDIGFRHEDILIAGAPFPDYFYLCGTDHDYGEDSHWPRFQAAAADYIRQNYKKDSKGNYPEDGEKLIAFFMGVVSHSIADVMWHGLAFDPQGYGLIETIGGFDYNGTGDLMSNAHSMADTGGEFLSHRQIDSEWFSPAKWRVPAYDLVKIFAMINDTITETQIYECQAIFTAGAEALIYIGDIVSLPMTDASPMFQDELLQMPVGGIDDMAVWTSYIWERFAEWVENGPPNSIPVYKVPELKKKSSTELIHQLGKIMFKEYTEEEKKLFSSELTSVCIFLQRAIQSNDWELKKVLQNIGATDNLLNQKFKRVCMKNDVPEVLTPLAKGKKLSATITLEGVAEYAYLGSSLAVLRNNKDKSVSIVAGSPGTTLFNQTGVNNTTKPNSFPQAGEVTIFSYPKLDVQKRKGENWFERFGNTLINVDINCDGIEDLVVGAPMKGWKWDKISDEAKPELVYTGEVSIFLGGKSNEPDLRIVGDGDMQFYGQVFSKGDIDGDGCPDLLIGSPMARKNPGKSGVQVGRVDLFTSIQIQKAIKNNMTLSSKDATKTLWGTKEYDRFGTSIAVSSKFLVVGIPGYRCSSSDPNDHCTTAGVSSTGAVFGYLISKLDIVQFSIEYIIPKSKFGQSIALKEIGDTNLLAVSAPSIPTNEIQKLGYIYGQVTLIDISTLKGRNVYEDMNLFFQLNAGIAGSRFGQKVDFAHFSGNSYDLVISAPVESSIFTHDYGSIYVFPSSIIHEGQVCDKCEGQASFYYSTEIHGERLGENFICEDLNGDGYDEILVSAPRRNVDVAGVSKKMKGAVIILSSK